MLLTAGYGLNAPHRDRLRNFTSRLDNLIHDLLMLTVFLRYFLLDLCPRFRESIVNNRLGELVAFLSLCVPGSLVENIDRLASITSSVVGDRFQLCLCHRVWLYPHRTRPLGDHRKSRYIPLRNLCFAEDEAYLLSIRFKIRGYILANEWTILISDKRDFSRCKLPETRARSYDMMLIDLW